MSGGSFARVTHNFINVTSSSPSSSIGTRSCLGVRVTRYGCGVRADSPVYPSRDMGSSGSGRMSYAQSSREIASHSSRSATWMPGQMRRLRQQTSAGKARGTLICFCERTPRQTSSGRGPSHWGGCLIQHTSVCLPGSVQG